MGDTACGVTWRGFGGSALATFGGGIGIATPGGGAGVASGLGGATGGEALTPGAALTKNASIPSIGANPAGMSTVDVGAISRRSSQ
jgi:hypothetical protein